MKITTFDPIIVSPDAESVIKLFEELGFEKKHAPTNDFGNGNVTSVRMKHPDGYHVDVVAKSQKADRDYMLIRMNVDDFDAAYEILTAHGFKNVGSKEILETSTAKSASMESPSGFRMAIVQHIK